MPHAHTPGPWTINQHEPCTVNAIYRNRENPLPFSICQVFGQNGEEAKANARLIATAPEMLEALQNVLRCAERDDVEKRRDMTGLNVHLTTRAVVAIRESITRATGRTLGKE